MHNFEVPLKEFFKRMAPVRGKDGDGNERPTSYEFELPVKASCQVAGIESLVEEIRGSRTSGVLTVRTTNGRSYKVSSSEKLSVFAVPKDHEIEREFFGPPEPEEVEEELNLDKMTVEELRKFAAANDIELPDGLKKAEIVDLIAESLEEVDEPAPA